MKEGEDKNTEKIIKKIDGICTAYGMDLMKQMYRNRVDIHIVETKQGKIRLILALRADLKEYTRGQILKIMRHTVKEIKIGFVYEDGSELQLSKIEIDAEGACHANDIDEEDLEGNEKKMFPMFNRA